MKIRNIRLLGSKGVTMVELIVAMLVLSILTVSITAVFMPMYKFYERANDFAEVNTLLDNLSEIILADVASARWVQGGTASKGNGFFTITTSFHIVYTLSSDGVLIREADTGSESAALPVLDSGFYRNMRLDSVTCSSSDGIVSITLRLSYSDSANAGSGSSWDRTYSARPIGMQ